LLSYCKVHPTTCCRRFSPYRMQPLVWLLEPSGTNASFQSYRSCTGFLFIEGYSSSSCACFTSLWLDRHRRT